MTRSLNRFEPLRLHLVSWRRRWLMRSGHVLIDPSARVSLSARLRAGPRADIEVGARTLVAFKTLLLAAGPDGRGAPIRIGSDCFIGGGAVIGPGVAIGDQVIVAAGAVVMAEVPSRSIVAGNPARVIREGITTGAFGRLPHADDNEARLWPGSAG